MDWINNFDLMLLEKINTFDIEKKDKNLIIKDFKAISSNADKFKWLNKLHYKEIKANSGKKYFYQDILDSIDEYSKQVLKKDETKYDDLIIGKMYSRIDVSVFANNGNNVSGVLPDKNSEDNKSVFIILNTDTPYEYKLENNESVNVNNEYYQESKKIKYYAYTRKNSNDFEILKGEKNQRIINANGLNGNDYIYAFKVENHKNKKQYKYLGKYIIYSQSKKSPFYFELFPLESLKNNELIKIASKNFVNSVDIFLNSMKNREIEEVEKKTLVKMRCDQGLFRKNILEKYNSKCPLTNIVNVKTLIASHIKPWCACKNEKEKLDPNNGILLSALADKLFDKGLITFNHNGEIIYSSELEESDIEIFKKHLANNILSMNESMKKYMIYHNKNVFIK